MQIFANGILSEDQCKSIDSASLLAFDAKNTNQSIAPISQSSILFYNNISKSDDYLPSASRKTYDSRTGLPGNNQLKSSIEPERMNVKHEIFINEPIAMKATNVLPGIGAKYAQQLIECGFSTVRRLLGFYLMIKDDQEFVMWLHNKVGISIHSAWLCTNALRAWCELYL